MKVFSGLSNPQLTKEVCAILNIQLGKSETVKFDNSEIRVRIIDDVKDKICTVIQSTDNPTDSHLMELFFFCDALKRQGAKNVIAFIPYFGYARQDIAHRPGECISANVIARFIETIGYSNVYTFDIHDEATAGVFNIPFNNLTAMDVLAAKIKGYLEIEKRIKVIPDNIAIISPDQGAIEKVRNFGTYLFGNDKFELVVIEKKRDQEHIHKAYPYAIYGNINKTVTVIVDDIVTSGSTILPAINMAKNKSKFIITAAVHHDFSPNTHQLLEKSQIEVFFTTNTIKLHKHHNFNKLTEVSIANKIAQQLKKYL